MEYVPVKTFDSYITANIWLGKLQDAGINCYLKDEYMVTIDPLLTNAIGGIKLCIDREQLEEGRELISAFEHNDKQKQQCIKCKSLNVTYINKPGAKNWLSAIVMWAFGSYPVSAAKQVYHCFDCGEEFEETQNEELNALAESYE